MKSARQLLPLFLLVLVACTGQVMNKDNPNQPASNPNNISLELDYQEVIRTDCINKVISDKIEVVKSPTFDITIPPKDPKGIIRSKFFNQSTGSTAPSVWNYTTFTIDHGDGAFSLHVITGINTIQYTFYTCGQFNESGGCAAEQMSETGTVTLNILYTEKTLPGSVTYNTCASPTPAPSP